ncbi:hypothetical protein P7L78_26540 [Tistrella bauzanensis]|uniref:hypothetical protein n=1 Tax=Tistrella TaxID=171436 RepID=UPI0031F6B38E
MPDLARYAVTIPYGALPAYLDAGWQVLADGPLAVTVVTDVPEGMPADRVSDLDTSDLRAAVAAALRAARGLDNEANG